MMHPTEQNLFNNARRLHAEATAKLNESGMQLFEVLSGREPMHVERLAFAQQKADAYRALVRTLESLFPNLPFCVAAPLTTVQAPAPVKAPIVSSAPPVEADEWITVPEAETLFGVGYQSLYTWTKAGEVRQEKKAGKALYSRSDVEKRAARMRKTKSLARTNP